MIKVGILLTAKMQIEAITEFEDAIEAIGLLLEQAENAYTSAQILNLKFNLDMNFSETDFIKTVIAENGFDADESWNSSNC